MKKTIDSTPVGFDKAEKVENKALKRWNVFSGYVFGRTIPQKMFRFYVFLIFAGAGFLCAPFALNIGYGDVVNGDSGNTYDFLDALFISCSAFSDTGLSSVDVSITYNWFGQAIIALLIELGGLGFMALVFVLWNTIRKWSTADLRQIIILQSERGNSKLGSSYPAIKYAIFFILATEVIFAVLLSFCFCFIPAYDQIQQVATNVNEPTLSMDSGDLVACYGNYGLSMWYGLFTSISAINNAGFDILGAYSMAPYRNDWGVVLQFLLMIEFVIGGLGFPLLFDLHEKIKAKRNHQHYSISLFSKLSISIYIIICVLGLAFAFGFELLAKDFISNGCHGVYSSQYANAFGDNPTFNETWCIIFNTFSTRSAGFSTVNQQIFSNGTKMLYSVLMFIGASPASTGGGIRTTTLGVICLSLWSTVRKKENVNAFKKTIPYKTVRESYIIFFIAFILVLFVSLASSLILNNGNAIVSNGYELTFYDIFYEINSAFGTVGLSTGVSALISTNVVGVLFIIITMFVGQLGVSSTLLSWTGKKPSKTTAKYIEEDVKIG